MCFLIRIISIYTSFIKLHKIIRLRYYLNEKKCLRCILMMLCYFKHNEMKKNHSGEMQHISCSLWNRWHLFLIYRDEQHKSVTGINDRFHLIKNEIFVEKLCIYCSC